MKKLKTMLVSVLLLICALLAGCGETANSTAIGTDSIDLRNNGTAIQWKYADETDWHDLVSISELKGAAGQNGADGAKGDDGADGKNIEIRKTEDRIQWRYAGENWSDLVLLSSLVGSAGKDGTNGADGKDGAQGKNGVDGTDGKDGRDGVDGKSVEIRKADGCIQWRLEGGEWQNIIALADLKGAAGKDGQNGTDGKNGIDGKDGVDGKDGINGTDGKNGIDGTNGKDGRDGADGKSVEIRKADGYVQWRLEGGEWQGLVSLVDIKGPAGANGTDGKNGTDGRNGANGKTPEFRVDGSSLQWRYEGDDVWLNLYDLSLLKGADGKNGKDGINGTDGKNGVDGKNGTDGKDGMCAGYFAAGGELSTGKWGDSLPFTVKKSSGSLISYNESTKGITLAKGHSYSLVFSGTASVIAKADNSECGLALVDGYSGNDIFMTTRTSLIIPKSGQTATLTVAYNTVYTAEEDITLNFSYNGFLFRYNDLGTSRYSITIIALD